MNKDSKEIAFDASARSVDSNGYLRVVKSHITKEGVNPYYGSEMEGGKVLGLDPDKLYYGYRPGEELEKAAATFNGLPLLFEHHFDSADRPQKEHRIGSLGTDAVYNAPYLDNSLIITDAEAIEAIVSGDHPELSSAYKYTPDFTPGEWDGQHYDFIMRNIVGNHVAIVEEGRAGSDVKVADSAPQTEQNKLVKGEIKQMDKMKELVAKLMEVLGAYEVNDAGGEVEEVAGGMVEVPGEENVMGDKGVVENPAPVAAGMDNLLEALEGIENPELVAAIKALIEQPAADEDLDVGIGGEVKSADGKGKTKIVSMDSIYKAVEDKMRAKQSAAQDCAPLVGEFVDPFAFDSAEAIYKKALELSGIDTSKYPASAYKGMVSMLKLGSSAAAVAADSSAKRSPSGVVEFKNLGNIKIG